MYTEPGFENLKCYTYKYVKVNNRWKKEKEITKATIFVWVFIGGLCLKIIIMGLEHKTLIPVWALGSIAVGVFLPMQIIEELFLRRYIKEHKL